MNALNLSLPLVVLESNAAFQAHDRLSDENADLKRRVKDLEDRQRSNEDLKQRFEDLQRRSRCLSRTTPAKPNPTNDSSSSDSIKSVASHSRPPDLDDSVSPPMFYLWKTLLPRLPQKYNVFEIKGPQGIQIQRFAQDSDHGKEPKHQS